MTECELCDEQDATRSFGVGQVCAECYAQVSSEPDSTIDTPGGEDGETGAEAVRLETEPQEYPRDWLTVDQWLTWKPHEDDGRKIPRAPWNNPEWCDKWVNPHEPENWTTASTAHRYAEALDGYELAFDLSEDDPYILLDGDDVRDPETGRVHPQWKEYVDQSGSYADISTSGTGSHILGQGELPEGVNSIKAELPEHPEFPDAEIEVYDERQFIAMTGDHVVGTPIETRDCQDLVGELVEQYATPTEPSEGDDYEPTITREEVTDIETTADIDEVFDAIRHVKPRDIRLRSTVTGDRGDGVKDLDPSWANSESGTRLAQFEDGWLYRKGDIPLDALQVVALEERIITDEEEYPSGDDFWEAVQALRERGAHIPEYDPADPMVVLPPDLQPANEWDWRDADRPDDALSLDAARERCVTACENALRFGDQVLIDALPSLGKSRGIVEATATVGTQISVFTQRHDQYDQYEDWCEELGLTYKVLPNFPDECPVAAGEHGDALRDQVMDWYQRGVTPRQIHVYAEEHLGHPLPCQDGESKCPYLNEWDFEADNYDVLIGHYTHAHLPTVIRGRTPVFDEFPEDAYTTELDIEASISSWLEGHDEIPFDTYTEVLEHRQCDTVAATDRVRDALLWFEEHGLSPDGKQALSSLQTHALAPYAVLTLLLATDLGNGWERAEFEDTIGLFKRETGTVYIHRPPDLVGAYGVIGLDGTPTPEMWETVLGTPLNHRQVLTDEERREYIRDTLGLTIIQTSEHLKPYSSGNHVSVTQDQALIAEIRRKEGRKPSLITSKKALFGGGTEQSECYESAGVLEDVRRHEHRGNVKGSNQFKHERLGVITGSAHYGDEYIKQWAALAGHAAERGEEKGVDLTYGEYGDKIYTHMTEHETFQEIMRFGRDGDGATVYVHTSAIPDWVPVAAEGRVLSTWDTGKGGRRQVIEAAAELGTWRASEIVDEVDLSHQQVLNHLHELEDRGYITKEYDGRGYQWEDAGLRDVNPHGDVDISTESDEDEQEQDPRFTWAHQQSVESRD